MWLASALTLAGGLVSLLVAVHALWVSRAPGWSHTRVFAVMAATAAAYSLTNLLFLMDGTPDTIIWLGSGASILFGTGHVVAWIFFAAAQEGTSCTRVERWAIGLSAALAVFIVGAELVAGPRTMVEDVPWLGLHYHVYDSIPTDSLLLVLSLNLCLPLRRYLRAWRARLPNAGLFLVAFGLFFATIVLEMCNAIFDMPVPYLGDLGLFAVTIAGSISVTRQIVADAISLSAQRATLTALNAELLELTRAKDEFVAMAWHELKTPLSALGLKLEHLAWKTANAGPTMSTEDTRRDLALALRQVGHLKRLVSDLLDVGRANEGALPLDHEELDLRTLVDDVVARMREQLAQAHCDIAVDAQPTTGHWDRRRMEQVLLNLLGNAVKYAPGSPLRVEVSSQVERVTLVVRDRGPGLPEGAGDRVFDRFARFSPPGTPGLGLGLYITKLIVDAHGGSIRVDSRAAEGTAFIVELPRQPATARHAESAR